MIRKPAGNSVDREVTANQTELAEPIDQLALQATVAAGQLKSIDSQGTLPVDLGLCTWTALCPELFAINIELALSGNTGSR